MLLIEDITTPESPIRTRVYITDILEPSDFVI